MPQDLQCKNYKLIHYIVPLPPGELHLVQRLGLRWDTICFLRQAKWGSVPFPWRGKGILPQYPTEKDKICATHKASCCCLDSLLWQVGVSGFSELYLSPLPCKRVLHWSWLGKFCLWAAPYDTSLQNHICHLAGGVLKVLGYPKSGQIVSTSVLNAQSWADQVFPGPLTLLPLSTPNDWPSEKVHGYLSKENS